MHATVALIVTSACGTLSKAAVVLESESQHDGLAEWSKALASGASPQGRGFEPHSRHSFGRAPPLGAAPSRWASQVGGPLYVGYNDICIICEESFNKDSDVPPAEQMSHQPSRS